MQYQILLQKPSNQHFVASVVGFSNVVADGKTEQEAVTKVKAALQSQLATSKLLTVDIDTELEVDNELREEEMSPWLKHFGVFADDPTFDDFLEEVAAYRKQVDEETNV